MALPPEMRGFLSPQRMYELYSVGNLIGFLGPEAALALLPLGIAGVGAAPGISDWIHQKIEEQYYEAMRREIRVEVARYMAWERERLRSVVP
jgi:hypothetical protein